MIRKSFISLYFYQDRYLLLQLNSKKNKVKVSASFKLPKGIITARGVQEEEMLARHLKAVWKKMKLSEKSLAVVIPEFATFTKLLSIPNMDLVEIDEAVLWQAQDFLPDPAAEMIIDWKIVGRKEGNLEILVVAIQKSVLSGFVAAAELAGLFPLAVETPSLCLSAATEDKTEGNRLVVYESEGESILLIAEHGKILGTSVIKSNDAERISTTASKMVAHYTSDSVKKVFVAGDQVSEQLVSKLEDKVGRPPELLKPSVSGFSDRELQSYIVPICMQLMDLEEPSDPESLNLLPRNLVEKYRQARLKVQMWSLTLTITLFVTMSFLVSLGVYLFMSQQARDLSNENASKSQISKQRNDAIEKVSKINSVSEKILKVKNIYLFSSDALSGIARNTPAGVDIETYDINMEKGTIQLSGIAADRLLLVEFKNNLTNDSDFGSVDIPFSSFTVENNLEFQLSTLYLPSTVKDTGESKI